MEPTYIEDIARITHEANRALQLIQGDPVVSPPWDEAPESQRESAKDGVRAALRGLNPEQLHDNWLAFKKDDGWTYGPVKDEELKQHPCFVPYDELPEDQKLKDYLFQAIVNGYLKGLGEDVVYPEVENPDRGEPTLEGVVTLKTIDRFIEGICFTGGPGSARRVISWVQENGGTGSYRAAHGDWPEAIFIQYPAGGYIKDRTAGIWLDPSFWLLKMKSDFRDFTILTSEDVFKRYAIKQPAFGEGEGLFQ